jgi:hypothetical protein
MKKIIDPDLIPKKVLSKYTGMLVEKLSPYVEYKLYPTGRRLGFDHDSVPKCYLIRSGAVTLHQQPGDVLIGMFEAPSIRGGVQPSANIFCASLSLRVSMPSEIAVLDHSQLLELIGQNGLWEIFAMHLQAVTNALFTHTLQLSTSSSSFEMVRNQLIELMNEPQLLRVISPAEKYIRSKTGISRSGTMRILAEMRASGFITMENGILKSINKIPEVK